jgi:S-adenosylmethionine hydrolase
VLDVDRFGNVRLNIRPDHVERAELASDAELQVTTPNGSVRARRITTYHDVPEGEYGILPDAWSWLSVVQFEAKASDGLGVERGDLVWVRRATEA